MYETTPKIGIFTNVIQKSIKQNAPFYPYRTQKFRLKEQRKPIPLVEKRQCEHIAEKKNIDNLAKQSLFGKINQKNPFKSQNKSQKTSKLINTPLILRKTRQNSSRSNIFSHRSDHFFQPSQQKFAQNSKVLNNQQTIVSSKDKEEVFRKTYCVSFSKNLPKNKSLQVKISDKRPPSSQVQTYRPSTRIRKISNIGQQNNNNFLAKYEIIKQLGKGTYGTVYLARTIKNKFKLPYSIENENVSHYENVSLSKNFLNNTQRSWVKIESDEKTQQIISTEENTSLLWEPSSNQKQLFQKESPQKQKNENLNQNESLIQKQKPYNEIEKVTNVIVQSQINKVKKQVEIRSIQQKQKQITNKQQDSNISSIEKQNTLQKDHPDDLFAIKVYQKFKMNKDPSKFKNIRKQITIMQNLTHQGIIKLYQSVQSLTKISLVVQFGGDLSLLDYLKKNFPLSEQKIKQFSKQLIQTILYLHQKNIVHRDIKPQNILVKTNPNDPTQEKLKLIDFGFSTLTNKSRKLNAICGTPNFMAPELLSSKQYFGQKADIWSYGVVIFVMAQGRHPFKSSQYQQLQRLVNKGKYIFKRKHHNTFQQFIGQILRVNSFQRPTAVQILKHKWLQQQ